MAMNTTNAERAINYRNRAEELRAIAAEMKHSERAQALLSLAEAYEKMARRVENEDQTR